MTRFISLLLLLVVALGAGSEMAVAEPVPVSLLESTTSGYPEAPAGEEVESSDEVVVFVSSTSRLVSLRATHIMDGRLESVSKWPQTRPPRV